MINYNSIKITSLILLISVFSQLGYANNMQTLDFTFAYGSGITSVSYNNPTLSDDSASDGSIGTPVAANGSYTVVVNTKINPDQYIATAFNSDLLNNAALALELNSTNEDLPNKLDFFTQSGLSINGHKVAGNFYLAHDSKDKNDWWIGSTDGTHYNPNPLRVGNIGMDFHTIDDPSNIQYFCLKQNGTDKFSVLVVAGTCNQTDWSNLKSNKFDFVRQTKDITSISFVYNNIPQTRNDLHNNIDYFQSLTDENYSTGNTVRVYSKLDVDENIANSFNQLPINRFSLKTSDYNIDLPTSLYFWVQGSLYINGNLIADDFTMAMSSTKDGGQWWIGSAKGSYSNEGFMFPNPYSELKNSYYCLIPTDEPYIIDVTSC